MEKKILVVMFILACFLFACSGPEATSRKLTPTGALANPEPIKVHEAKDAPVVVNDEPEQTAAEALTEAKQTVAESEPVKAATSIYEGVESTKTGEDALKEKTRAAYSVGSDLSQDVDADSTFGSKYHSSSGNLINVPEGYGEDTNYD
ncbi:hypothetical protein KY329_00755 [Candidatus Woesearchaeota archaeon]|nr:hypothetical protein [Candidatus Woesearchaeota archaeon]